MEKIPFNISAAKQGTRALIRITGTIGWDTNAELFRSQVDGLVAQGVEDVHVYINSPGGSCFDAAEIINILTDSFKGVITGEGGALVASAATFIAAHCKIFEMPENGMFMIHKPQGGNFGTANELEAYLKLLRNLEAQYYNVYQTKTTDAAELQKHWEAGDWWLTAKEALDNGFITSVKAPILIDHRASAIIVASGCPQNKIPNIKKKQEMELKAMAISLGLPETATEMEVTAAITAGRKAQTDLAELQRSNKEKEAAARAKAIDDALTAAVNDKRITADMRPKWQASLEANFEVNSELLTSLSPVVKLPIDKEAAHFDGALPANLSGKTFEQLQEEDPEALAELMENNPQAYDALYGDYLKRNKLKK